MLVFWKQALVFLATPKTAWTAIEQAIGSLATISMTVPTATKHTDMAQFNDHLKPYLRATTGLDFATTALLGCAARIYPYWSSYQRPWPGTRWGFP